MNFGPVTSYGFQIAENCLQQQSADAMNNTDRAYTCLVRAWSLES